MHIPPRIASCMSLALDSRFIPGTPDLDSETNNVVSATLARMLSSPDARTTIDMPEWLDPSIKATLESL